jgi:hypothetical protein
MVSSMKISIAIFFVHLMLVNIIEANIIHKHSKKQVLSTRPNCKNRPHYFMDKRLLELRITYENGQQAKMKNRFTELNDADYVDVSELGHLYEESGCLDMSSNKTLQYPRQKSTCPWEVVIKERDDRWPSRIAEAKCTCTHCNTLNDVALSKYVYRCMPVLMPTPVLLREDVCDFEGFFKWIDAVELINYGCSCGVTVDMISN